MKKFLSSVIVLLITVNTQANLQITTVTGNNTFGSGSYMFDLNLDGIDDFKIKKISEVYVECLNPGAMIQINGSNEAIAFSNGATIGAHTWSSVVTSPMNLYYGQNTRYLGLKLVVGNDTYYGWASIQIPANYSYFTIFSYAYEDTPNTPVKAGQSATGIFENSISDLHFMAYPNPAKTNAYLYFDKAPESSLIAEFTDITGKRIYEAIITDNKLYLQEAIFKKGIYFLRVYSNNTFAGTKRILVE